MMDLIDRQALLKQIGIDSDDEPGYYGDTWKFIDTIKKMPPAVNVPDTNIGELISRHAAIDAVRKGYPDVINSEYKDGLRIGTDRAIYHLEKLPPAQSEIIRCRDCKYWVPGYITDNDDFIPPKCGEWQQMVGHSSDDYCSLAERREVTT